MAETKDIISAIEGYLASKGKGDSYLSDKITELFESPNSPISLNGKIFDQFSKMNEKFSDAVKKMVFQLNHSKIDQFNKANLKFSDAVKKMSAQLNNSKFDQFNKSTNKFSQDLKKFKLPNFAKLQLPNFAKEITNLRNIIKSVIKNSKINAAPVEAATSSTETINVRLVDMSPNIMKMFNSLARTSTATTRNVNRAPNPTVASGDDSGSFVSKLLKGIFSVGVMLAGVGFIDKFLETPSGQIMSSALKNIGDSLKKNIGPFFDKLSDVIGQGLKILLLELPKKFLKSTFSFFGLKEMLGDQNEGIAVILTKGIYYGVKTVFTKVLNNASFGLFGNLTARVKSIVTKPFVMMGEWLSKTSNAITPVLTASSNTASSSITSRVSGFFKKLISPVTSFVSGFFKKLISPVTSFVSNFSNFFKGSAIGGGLVKVTSFFKGGIFKLLGPMLKNVAKKIPFIGALISLKDAVDRFKKGDYTGGLISIGSGISSFFPGLGTAISIGLDLLNAFLDKKTEGGTAKTGKLTVLKDLFVSFVGGVYDFFSNLISDIWGLIKDAAGSIKSGVSSWVGEKISGIWNWGNDKPANSRPPVTTIPVQDGSIFQNRVVQPSSADQVIAMKSGGPFDVAFGKMNDSIKSIKTSSSSKNISNVQNDPSLKEMNAKMDALIKVMIDVGNLIASTTAQGSNGIIQAVSASGGSQNVKQTPIGSGGDPIGDYRNRAQRAIEFVSR